MPNISGHKIKSIGVFFIALIVLAPRVDAANVLEEGKAIIEKYIEDAVPLFDPHEVDAQAGKEADKFYEKIRKKRAEFLKEEQERKSKFFAKIRQKNLRDENTQREVVEFRAETLERMQKFNEKQKREIEKHIEKEKG